MENSLPTYMELKKTPHVDFLEACLSQYQSKRYYNSCTAISQGVVKMAKSERYNLTEYQQRGLSRVYYQQYKWYSIKVGQPQWWGHGDGNDDAILKKVEFIKKFIEFFTKRGKWLPAPKEIL